MDIREAISFLENESTTASEGLPYELFLFVSQITPLVSVDLLIKDTSNSTLFTWRDDEFFGTGWHLPGGVIRHNETIEQRIGKVGQLELGAQLSHEANPLTFVQDVDPSKKYRGHFVAFLYRCSLLSGLDPSLQFSGHNPRPGEWAWFKGQPGPLINVHHVYREFF